MGTRTNPVETISLTEVCSLLGGVPKNAVKTFLKREGIVHDGSRDMMYPIADAHKAIQRYNLIQKAEQERRAKISLRRKIKAAVDSEHIASCLGLNEDQVELLRIAYNLETVSTTAFDAMKQAGDFDALLAILTQVKSGMSKASVARLHRVSVEAIDAALDAGIIYAKGHSDMNTESLSEGRTGRWIDPILATSPALKNYLATYVSQNEETEDSSQIQVVPPSRKSPPAEVYFHLGPTNSGKTYNALEDLARSFSLAPDGRYVYCGPLRMLAYEVYTKMGERFGYENVGFVTGEEKINEDAPIIAATVEMAPMRGDLLIIDEAHWVKDVDRGHYWSKLILAAEYYSMHIIAAEEAYEGLLPLIADAEHIYTQKFQRRTKIAFDGSTFIRNIPKRSAVVCFTRFDVFGIYEQLMEQGKKACVLYGSLPVEVRKKIIHDFEAGVYDVIVTTNVIGHGINLPIDHVVFAGTEKFNGQETLPVPLFEAGQIAGRAGRYGISDMGHVHYLEGVAKPVPDPLIARAGANVAAGRQSSELEVEKVYIAPKFEHLGIGKDEAHLLVSAYKDWSGIVTQETDYLPSPMPMAIANLEGIARLFGARMDSTAAAAGRNEWKIPADELWKIAAGPFDLRNGVLETAISWRSNPVGVSLMNRFVALTTVRDAMKLQAVEERYKALFEFKMLSVMFEEGKMLGDLPISAIKEQEERIVEMIFAKLQEIEKKSSVKDAS